MKEDRRAKHRSIETKTAIFQLKVRIIVQFCVKTSHIVLINANFGIHLN